MSHDNNQGLIKLASELVENLADCATTEPEIVAMYEAWALKRLTKALASVEKRVLDAELRVRELEKKFAITLLTDEKPDTESGIAADDFLQSCGWKQGDHRLDELKVLIESEIADFFAGYDSPGEPESPEAAQAQLLARLETVFKAA